MASTTTPGLTRTRWLALRRASGVLTCLALLVASSPADAQVRELRWDPPVDLSVMIGSSVVLIASLALQPRVAPTTCRWCETNSLDERVRASLVWHDTRVADEVSSVTGFILAPAATLGLDAVAASHDHASRGVGLDALLVLEATMVALDVDSVTKLLVARGRPYMRPLPRRADGDRAHSPEDNLSFFSGHTTTAFALAAATGTVATMRGYRWAPVPWIAGGALAAGTGYLRVAADRHWLSDVLVGAAMGIAIGIAVPVLFHAPSGSSSSQ
jgi:membrane-associated phospholipid phosphatase